MIRFNKIREKVKSGLIVSQKHPKAKLFIYNYTKTCQFEKKWDEETLQCRGLILDEKGNIVARPFPKFFNWQEPEAPEPGNEFEVYKKLDGSLGILYWLNDAPYIASRGSFNSPQALKASEILHARYNETFENLEKDKTYLFEIIYPTNRVVVDYGNLEDIILLGVVENETGNDLGIREQDRTLGFPVVKSYPFATVEELAKLNLENEEGFVLRKPNGDRLKVKFEEYKRLHAIVTETSSLSIWRAMMSGESLNMILENVPDEFYDWANSTIKKITKDYISTKAKVYSLAEKVLEKDLDSQESFEFLKEIESDRDLIGLALAASNRRERFEDSIWSKIRPEHEKPFSQNVE